MEGKNGVEEWVGGVEDSPFCDKGHKLTYALLRSRALPFPHSVFSLGGAADNSPGYMKVV